MREKNSIRILMEIYFLTNATGTDKSNGRIYILIVLFLYFPFMFDFLSSKKTQKERILELLIKYGKVSSLTFSQMNPVILNWRDPIMDLRVSHNIETQSELVKGKKHTTYIYHGRKFAPMPRVKVKHYTEEDIINAFNAWLALEAPNAEAYLKTL